MKFKCSTSQLSEAFQLLSTVIPARSPRPTLNNVRIESKDGSLELSATDSEIALRYLIPESEIIEPGVISIPASNITSILRETSDETVELTSENENCSISTSDSSYKIHGDDPHNFPFIPFLDDTQPITLPVQILTDCIHKTAFATSKEKTRYALNGILLKAYENKLEMVATDGKRLALVSRTLEGSISETIEAIIPTKAMNIMERLGTASDTAQLSIQENLVQFVVGGVTLCAKLVEGTFPNYEEVIPTTYTKSVSVDKERFFSAVRRASLFTSEESKAITVSLKDGAFTLKSHSDVAGDAEITIPVESNEELEIAFNPEFIVDVLRVSDQPNLTFEFMEFNRPLVVKPSEGFVNIIMPISATG